ncbi:MAG: hypothetical protein AB7K52_14240 [Phycisphaerales bacterium]
MSAEPPAVPPPSDAGIEIMYQRFGRSGGVNLSIRIGGGEPFTDRVVITDAAKRAAFVAGLLRRFQGLEESQVSAEFERVAAEVASSLADSNDDKNADEASHATMLVALMEARGEQIELFHTPGGDDSAGYASLSVEGHRETWALNSRTFKRWLSREFYLQEEAVPSGQALADAINVLTAKALHEGPEYAVHLRTAEHEGAIWLDLCDTKWRAVKVTAGGWTVEERDIPVRFVRKRGMLPLPIPVAGGSISLFRNVVNLPSDDQWILAVSWLIAALRPGRPLTLLNVNGEQGSAKSTLCKMLRMLIDPAKPPLRRPPRDDRDLMIAANNSGVVAYDNISGLSAALSDSLCSLATGGGFATRELYSDDDEKLFDASRPVLLNGIEDSVIRPDLLDRSINVMLPKIEDGARRDEDELWREFYRVRPRILGAILTALSTGLRNLPTTALSEKPRMADFAHFVCAAEPALPWEAGEFIRAYRTNRADAMGAAVDASPVALALLTFIEEVVSWEGTAGDLLESLNGRYQRDNVPLPKDWPRNRKVMGNDLRRIAPALRAMGVEVQVPKGRVGRKRRLIFRILQSPGTRSAWSASSARPRFEVRNGLQPTLGADHAPPAADHAAPPRSASGARPDTDSESARPLADHADDADHRPGDIAGRGDDDEEEFI